MATLILTAVGTMVGGPLGGAIGALVGQQVDAALIGGRKVEGPRLKDLSVQTSSYGSALPLHFGTIRAAGSVIWSTDLIEHQEQSGGGKGQPSVTQYTYTASFAVAISSRPIAGIGRVWADGNLLRGAAGDLKVGGTMRILTGYGDQPADPLLAQAEGVNRCPAYRHCAYVVFEDLQLADFGNRLPSLTFEVLADTGGTTIAEIAAEIVPEASRDGLDVGMAGFTIDQGTPGDVLATIGEAVPLSCAALGDTLDLRLTDTVPAAPVMLPAPAASEDAHADSVKAAGWSRQREPLPRTTQCALRYYDTARDYQPGLQRGIGRSDTGDVSLIELPAALSAEAARGMADAASRRAARARDTIRYRTTEINTTMSPGAVVRLPMATGLWRIEQWEWQKDGVLLDLVACAGSAPTIAASAKIDAGRAIAAPDRLATPTILHAFELPWDGLGNGTSPQLFAAASAASAGWTGAALFARDADGTLGALGSTSRRRAVAGHALGPLPAASPLLVDRASVLDVQLAGNDLELRPASLPQLLQGANRALVGMEIIQFGCADPLGGGTWRLSGLLRGRGGTEWAVDGHTANEAFVLLDERLTRLDAAIVGDEATSAIVAVGLGDPQPVVCPVAGAGTTLRPLSPVRGVAARAADGSLTLSWLRRSRGSWIWRDGVEVPLNEEQELWDIAYGDASSPMLRWRTNTPSLTIASAQASTLLAPSVPATFHVRQVGQHALSPPLAIALPS